MLHHIRILTLCIRRPRPTPLQVIFPALSCSLLLQPHPLLLFQTSLRSVLLPGQLLPLNEERNENPQRRKGGVEDPHDLQTVRVRDVDGVFLLLG